MGLGSILRTGCCVFYSDKVNVDIFKMGKHKALCSKCNKRHFPPTGKRCQEVYEQSAAEEVIVKPKKKGSKIGGLDSQLSKSKLSSSMSPSLISRTFMSRGLRPQVLRTRVTVKKVLTRLIEAVRHYS